jgi:hypothetical protein
VQMGRAAMKPSHAAALALVGWYLMVPPVQQAPWTVSILRALGYKTYMDDPKLAHQPDRDASLSRWDTLETFETLEGCKAKLAQRQSRFDKRQPPYDRLKSENERIQEQPWLLTYRCVASDDPRLKGN